VVDLNSSEDIAWTNTDIEDLWIYDKLILSKKMGYVCGPTGVDVPQDGFYIVRPVTNIVGLGIGAYEQYLTVEGWTDHLQPGTFWSEIFEGDHLSIDYEWGEPILNIQGFRYPESFVRWKKWIKVEQTVELPDILKPMAKKYQFMNCEYIGGKLIEVHLRKNPDFEFDNVEFIPVWEGQDTTPPEGYRYVDCPEYNQRIGAFVR
jgi:hypothetical protein